MPARRRTLLSLAVGLLIAVQPGAAQPHPDGAGRFDEEHRRAVAANPSDLSLTLRLDAATSRFQLGQVIPIEIAFASSSPGRYELDGALYDRSGRLHYEWFHLEPRSGATDPLWEYFTHQFMLLGGGIRTVGVLGPMPAPVRLELNEWIRFDRPGTYRLYVTSLRVADLRAPTSGVHRGNAIACSAFSVSSSSVRRFLPLSNQRPHRQANRPRAGAA